jgi:quercetin dioxygenase-like cupin family protein
MNGAEGRVPFRATPLAPRRAAPTLRKPSAIAQPLLRGPTLRQARAVPPDAAKRPFPATVYTDLFGGKGRVQVTSRLPAGAEPFTAGLACELEPGGRVGAHRQAEFAELLIGVAGHGEARVNGAVLALTPASVVHVPLGAVLELENLSEATALVYVIVKARA